MVDKVAFREDAEHPAVIDDRNAANPPLRQKLND
jgi:hypothetical protein